MPLRGEHEERCRVPSSSPEVRRVKAVGIRWTEAERIEVGDVAAAIGMSRSEFCRQVILRSARDGRRRNIGPRSVPEIRRELRRVGAQLQRILVRLEARDDAPVPPKLAPTVDRIAELVARTRW